MVSPFLSLPASLSPDGQRGIEEKTLAGIQLDPEADWKAAWEKNLQRQTLGYFSPTRFLLTATAFWEFSQQSAGSTTPASRTLTTDGMLRMGRRFFTAQKPWRPGKSSQFHI